MVVLWNLYQYNEAGSGSVRLKKGTELGVMPRHIWPPEVAAKNKFFKISMYLWPKTNAQIWTLYISDANG